MTSRHSIEKRSDDTVSTWAERLIRHALGEINRNNVDPTEHAEWIWGVLDAQGIFNDAEKYIEQHDRLKKIENATSDYVDELDSEARWKPELSDIHNTHATRITSIVHGRAAANDRNRHAF